VDSSSRQAHTASSSALRTRKDAIGPLSLSGGAIWASAPGGAPVPARVPEPVEAREMAVAPAGAAEGAACLEADGRHTCCPARLWAG